MHVLRDGTVVEDIRLDRLIEFDEKSRNYGLGKTLDKEPRSHYWNLNIEALDQKSEGACVGFGISGELACDPAAVKGITNRFARELYWKAQREDNFPGGEYPGAYPRSAGTSVLAGMKAAREMGYIEGWKYAFGLMELILGIDYDGPSVMGTNWYNDMYTTDKYGFVEPTGDFVGGHCWLVYGVNWEEKFFLCRNSWGSEYGINGDFYLSFDGMEFLLKNNGESVFFEGRHENPIMRFIRKMVRRMPPQHRGGSIWKTILASR